MAPYITKRSVAVTTNPFGYSSRNDIEQELRSIIEDYKKGLSFDDMLAKRSKVKQYVDYQNYINERKKQDAAKEKERRRLAAEKKAIEDAKRLEAVQKLTPEEREAFGLNERGYKKR